MASPNGLQHIFARLRELKAHPSPPLLFDSYSKFCFSLFRLFEGNFIQRDRNDGWIELLKEEKIR